METVKISSLLCKRDVDFDNITNNVVEIVGPNVIKAVQYFLNKVRKMSLLSLERMDILPGFCMLKLSMSPNVGDIINTSKGQLVIDDSNASKFLQNIELMVSLKALDTNSAFVIYKNIKDVNHIAATTKEDTVEKLLKYNLLPLDEQNTNINILETHILENPEFCDILDILTKPKHISILGFDPNSLNEFQITNLKILESMENQNMSVN
jgi:hypothetical protein